MVNNSVKLIALGTLAAVGVLGLVSEAQAQHFKYPQTQMVSEGSPSPVEWSSNPGPRAFERQIQKVVFECVPQADGTFVTEEKVVEITFNPAQYPVYTETNLSTQYVALGELTGTPMILWTEDVPSSNPEGLYTPESRCQTVSARLTNLAYSFGATTPVEVAQAFNDRMAVGSVNGERVIFISYDPENASTQNVVFTLRPGNGATFADSQRTLAQFQNSISGSIGGSGDPSELGPIVE
ncbi:MAG: COP23 domain-containing protein [Crocosphaera sp.]